MKQYYIEIDKINTRITEWGSEHKPTLLCLHGMGCTGVHFIELVEKLEDSFRIIAPDLPGFGKTPPYLDSKSYGFPKMTNWIDELVNRLDLQEFFLVGHSWGANIGLFYMAEFSHKVKNFLMLDGAYHLKQMILDYNLGNDKILFDCTTIEECRDGEIPWFKEVYGGRRYISLDKYVEDEKEDYSRWTPEMEKAHLETAIWQDDTYVFHATSETGIAILDAFYNYPSNLVYTKLKQNNISDKITLIASTCIADDDWKSITYKMIDKFEHETGAKVKRVPIPHMMIWEDPDFVCEEILEWCRV